MPNPDRHYRKLVLVLVLALALNVAVVVLSLPAHATDASSAVATDPGERAASIQHVSTDAPDVATEPAIARHRALTVMKVNASAGSSASLLATSIETKSLTTAAAASVAVGNIASSTSRSSSAGPIALDGPGAILTVLVFALVLLRRRLR